MLVKKNMMVKTVITHIFQVCFKRRTFLQHEVILSTLRIWIFFSLASYLRSDRIGPLTDDSLAPISNHVTTEPRDPTSSVIFPSGRLQNPSISPLGRRKGKGREGKGEGIQHVIFPVSSSQRNPAHTLFYSRNLERLPPSSADDFETSATSGPRIFPPFVIK